MCTSFAKDLKRWTCDEELAARDAMLGGWAKALHEAATAGADDAAAAEAVASMDGASPAPAAAGSDPSPAAARPAR